AMFAKMSHLLFLKLKRWAYRRHPQKSRTWVAHKYWRLDEGHWTFSPPDGVALYQHNSTPIRRHIKVRGVKSPYDGDWVYWTKRQQRQPGLAKNVMTLLKRQEGRCPWCHLYFQSGDTWQIDHIIPKSRGGQDGYHNLQLLHAHCHHHKTASEHRHKQTSGADDNSHLTEEPDEARVSRPVLQPSGGGDPVA
ncbi:MAG: group II intron reverse transcriptase/maturase, partial [Okeania sp. SIO3B3]|nr:group II intron reverse transcriptase/maturase [Okeania sp. SIO3B3]